MLDIRTFDARRGGNVLYKALAHPLAAEGLRGIGARIGAAGGTLAVYDPDGAASMLYALHPNLPRPAEIFVHDVDTVGETRLGQVTKPLLDVGASTAKVLLVAAFDTHRITARLAGLLPEGMELISLDAARLPEAMLTSKRVYLDKLNFATNFAFFRDSDGLSSRVVTANYWAEYGAREVRFWLRLFDGAGAELASWEQPIASGAGGIVIDSREVRARFGLGAFAGQLFIHAIGVAGHDVVKYALDTYGHDGEPSLSVTHDANAWPSDRYAGLPAPRPDETVVLWVQNSHAAPIPAGAITLDRMGAEQPVPVGFEIAPYASVKIDVATLLPGLAWPAQIEVRSGRHVVRPRYEVTRAGRTRIAHMNVERADLRPEPAIATLPDSLGRGFILPFPVLDPAIYRSIVLPTPMAETQADLPLRIDVFDRAGTLVTQRFLGRLERSHDLAIDLAELGAPEGHADLVYDFRDGGGADGWMHALVRYERHEGAPHAAETSFGAHIFNTLMTWRDEPQSYSGPPPGLSTRLFLKLGHPGTRSFAAVIYPASAAWRAFSDTALILHDASGQMIAEERIAIACSGSALVEPDVIFGAERIAEAGVGGYVLIRDTTCRLFGYHGLQTDEGAFSLDHMFGF